MKNVSSITCLLLLVCAPVFGGDYVRTPYTRSLGMGMYGVTQSVLFNPALISLSSKKELSTSYYNRYAMKELGTISASFLYPNKILDTHMAISSYGYDAYRESMLLVSVSKMLGKRFTLGAAITYRFLQTEVMDELPSQLAVDLGVTYRPVKDLLLGISVLNYPSVVMNKHEEMNVISGYSLQAGFAWQFLPQLLLVGEVINTKETDVKGSLGIEYELVDNLYVRAGVITGPLIPSMGVGYSFSLFTIDVAVTYHQLLGISTGAGLKVIF